MPVREEFKVGDPISGPDPATWVNTCGWVVDVGGPPDLRWYTIEEVDTGRRLLLVPGFTMRWQNPPARVWAVDLDGDEGPVSVGYVAQAGLAVQVEGIDTLDPTALELTLPAGHPNDPPIFEGPLRELADRIVPGGYEGYLEEPSGFVHEGRVGFWPNAVRWVCDVDCHCHTEGD
jgi:hypothetical protein